MKTLMKRAITMTLLASSLGFSVAQAKPIIKGKDPTLAFGGAKTTNPGKCPYSVEAGNEKAATNEIAASSSNEGTTTTSQGTAQ